MMPAALLALLDRLGCRIDAGGDSLRVNAPAGALRPELLAELRQHKQALLSALRVPLPAESLPFRWLLLVDPESLPATPWPFRPGWRVLDNAGWLRSLRDDLALGESGPRWRLGAAQEDLGLLADRLGIG
jgi:hypothetical protein